MNGMISHIRRFSVSDGPGIRTTVFLKGCPLSCAWCHNIETQRFVPELLFYKEKCIKCGLCTNTCKNNCDIQQCTCCGSCVRECPVQAREIRGIEMSVEQVLQTVQRDAVFYQTTGGGMTISGGEPLAQFEYTRELLKAAKTRHIHTALDTSGYGDRIDELLAYTDLFLWDIKETNSENHRKHTGVALEPILISLKSICEKGGQVRLRCPIISDINDREDHIIEICRIVNEFDSIQAVDLLAYHTLGLHKAAILGHPQKAFKALTEEAMEQLLILGESVCLKPISWRR